MTPLKTLAGLQEKATKGPWFNDQGTPGHIKSKWDGHRPCGDGLATPTVAEFNIWSKLNARLGALEGIGLSKSEEDANGEFIAACGSFDFTALCDEMERMRKALEFYADEETWRGMSVNLGYGDVRSIDLGQRAREALGGKDE